MSNTGSRGKAVIYGDDLGESEALGWMLLQNWRDAGFNVTLTVSGRLVWTCIRPGQSKGRQDIYVITAEEAAARNIDPGESRPVPEGDGR
jgi:hypothetical protein